MWICMLLNNILLYEDFHKKLKEKQKLVHLNNIMPSIFFKTWPNILNQLLLIALQKSISNINACKINVLYPQQLSYGKCCHCKLTGIKRQIFIKLSVLKGISHLIVLLIFKKFMKMGLLATLILKCIVTMLIGNLHQVTKLKVSQILL